MLNVNLYCFFFFDGAKRWKRSDLSNTKGIFLEGLHNVFFYK